MTETYQFLITVIVLLGGGYVIYANPSSTLTNLVAGLMGVVVTFWFGSRSALGNTGATTTSQPTSSTERPGSNLSAGGQ